MNCFDEIIKTDNLDLFQCVYPLTRNLKRNFKDVLQFKYYNLQAGQFSMLGIAAGAQGSNCLKFLIEKGDHVNQVSNEIDRAYPIHFAILAQN